MNALQFVEQKKANFAKFLREVSASVGVDRDEMIKMLESATVENFLRGILLKVSKQYYDPATNTLSPAAVPLQRSQCRCPSVVPQKFRVINIYTKTLGNMGWFNKVESGL